MTKRERRYHYIKKRHKFWNKAWLFYNDYILATLKMQQLVKKDRIIPDALIEVREDAIKDLEQLLQK